MSQDPRKRKDRHGLTTENLQTSIQITDIPNFWSIENINSVIAGSGRIINISKKNDSRNNDKLTSITYDYINGRECDSAFELLNKINNFPCKLEKIIPLNYREKLIQMKSDTGASSFKEIELNRDNFPWDIKLDLPFQMITAYPLPKKPIVNTNVSNNANNSNNINGNGNHNNSNNSGINSSNNNNNLNGAPQIIFPDILSKASQHLPPFQENLLNTVDMDGISQNLSKIGPLQLIEILANLKILANQDISKKPQVEKILQSNENLVIAVSQALLEMGFITTDIINDVMKLKGISTMMDVPPPTVNTNNIINNGKKNKHNNNQFNNNQFNPNPFGFPPPTTMGMIPGSMNPSSSSTSATPPINTNMNNTNNLHNTQDFKINYTKLQTLPQNQQDMIKQVLTLTDEQVKQLPQDQQAMVTNLKGEYLIR